MVNDRKRSPAGRSRDAMRRRAKRSGLGKLFGITVFVALLVGGGWALVRTSFDFEEAVRNVADNITQRSGDETTLFFADPQWTKLVAEERKLKLPKDRVDRITKLTDALIEGPRTNAVPTLPRDAKVVQVYLGDHGLAIIDFAEPMEELRSAGSSGELLAVFSLIHTIVENVSGIETVQILIKGEQLETLAGHVKISEPLGPNTDLSPN